MFGYGYVWSPERERGRERERSYSYPRGQLQSLTRVVCRPALLLVDGGAVIRADGAEIRQPLGPSAWSPLAGQLRDRFGVVWALDSAAGAA